MIRIDEFKTSNIIDGNSPYTYPEIRKNILVRKRILILGHLRTQIGQNRTEERIRKEESKGKKSFSITQHSSVSTGDRVKAQFLDEKTG